MDLVVGNAVVVEVKCIEAIHPIHEAQLLSYLRLSGIHVGLLINFYVAHLRDCIKRMVDGWNWDKQINHRGHRDSQRKPPFVTSEMAIDACLSTK